MKHTLAVSFFILIIAVFLPLQNAFAQWSYVGGNITHNNAYAANYSLATDTAGMPYVAFADLGNAYVVTVKKLDAGGWVEVGTPGFITGTGNGSSLFYNPGISVAINPVDNSPWVALADGNNDNKISVMRFNGTAWVYVGSAGFTAESSCNVKLVFTRTGIPYLVYNACYNGNGISVMKYTSGSWSYAGAQNFATANYFNVAVSPANTVNIAYQDRDNGNRISVKSFNGASWLYAGGAGFSAGEIENVNITADADNNLYVCYVDFSQASKLTVKKLVANVWTTVGDASFSQFTAGNSDISINRFGVPYVSYVDGSMPVVKKFTNGSWNSVGNFVAAGFSQHTSVFNDSLGNPWVLTSLQPSATLPFLLKYKPCNDPDYGYTANVSLDSAITQTGGTTTVTVSATGGVGPYNGTGTFTVTAGYYTYNVIDANGCSIIVDINVTEPQPVCDDNYWLGTVSTDWNDTNNWSCGSLPGEVTTVHLETGATFYPVINTEVVCRQMTVSTGVTITVASGGHIKIAGQ